MPVVDQLSSAAVQLNPSMTGDRGPAQDLSLSLADKNRRDLQTVNKTRGHPIAGELPAQSSIAGV